MSLANILIPTPVNETTKDYAPGSEERVLLLKELERQRSHPVEIPLIIGGKPVRTGITKPIICPHDHQSPLGIFHCGDKETADLAVRAALDVAREWSQTPWEDRAAIFLKAAELLAGRYRYVINAATMLGQSKNVLQAEIDAACELVDYLRFNVSYMNRIYDEQIRYALSGTNDKAGTHLNLLRWVSPRTIKENFAPPVAFAYPHMHG